MKTPTTYADRPMTRWGRLGLAPRRGTGVSSSPAEELGQPQDGALLAPLKALRGAATSSLREPEDAGLTGGRRSLMRRVLGLNVVRPAVKPNLSLPVFLRKTALQQLPTA